jgi:hypothetical protein
MHQEAFSQELLLRAFTCMHCVSEVARVHDTIVLLTASLSMAASAAAAITAAATTAAVFRPACHFCLLQVLLLLLHSFCYCCCMRSCLLLLLLLLLLLRFCLCCILLLELLSLLEIICMSRPSDWSQTLLPNHSLLGTFSGSSVALGSVRGYESRFTWTQ